MHEGELSKIKNSFRWTVEIVVSVRYSQYPADMKSVTQYAGALKPE
jgi:hypothetical protein